MIPLSVTRAYSGTLFAAGSNRVGRAAGRPGHQHGLSTHFGVVLLALYGPRDWLRKRIHPFRRLKTELAKDLPL